MSTPADLRTRVEHVKSAVSILDVLERIGVDVHGTADQQVRCPFHADSRPSARVYAREGRIHCFTCSRGWDVVDAVREHQHLADVNAALAWIENEFDLGAADPVSVAEVTRQTRTASPDALTALVERTLHTRSRAIGFDRAMRAWLVFDIASAQYRAGSMSQEDYTDALHMLYGYE